MSEDNFAVGIVNYVCPICGKTAKTDIIMNTRLTQKAAQEVREANGKVVGYSDNACEECASHKDKVVYIVEIDASKSEPNNPYRTGYIWGIKSDIPLITDCEDYIITTKDGVRFMFMDIEAAKKLGFHELNTKKNYD